MDQLAQRFEAIGLVPEKAAETANNKKLAPLLSAILEDAGLLQQNEQCERSVGLLFYELAAALSKQEVLPSFRTFLARRIQSGDLRSREQVLAAVLYVKDRTAPISDPEFNQSCGVGIDPSPDAIQDLVAKLIETVQTDLQEKRYQMTSTLLKMTKEHEVLKWASGALVAKALEAELLRVLGPKDDRDDVKKQKKAKKEKKSVEDVSSTAGKDNPDSDKDPFFFGGELGKLHRPGGNKQLHPHLMEAHLKATGGLVMTRFPPEPNGHLHIGHAKAININFGYAAAHGGQCLLRYDDTNPTAEEQRYFDSILGSVRWLGFEPKRITYSSDHFQRLYDLALELIRRDKAYVCHCTGEEMHMMRGGDTGGERVACQHRSRPIEESLKCFKKMKEGGYAEGEATLRMKMDLENPSPQFWDLVAYRVMFASHVRTGDEWCIYPTYDYTHCLCDSFENITHSLCTTEFRLSRESYYWLCDQLEVYKPVQWEYGRLNLTHTVLSKRKLTRLVEDGIVKGWDDPRLYTLVALKRRGFPAEAINAFVRQLGVSTAVATVDMRKLESVVRQWLDQRVPRVMAVVRPVLVVLTNLDETFYEEVEAPWFPHKKDQIKTSRMLPFTRYLYLDREDVRTAEEGGDDPNFFRLKVGGAVHLLHLPHPIYCKQIHFLSSADNVHSSKTAGSPATTMVVEAEYMTPEHPLHDKIKAKSHVHWVALSHPTPSQPKRLVSPVWVSECRLYNELFLHPNPMQAPGGWLSDVNPHSLELIEGQTVMENVASLQLEVKEEATKEEAKVVQWIRTGYFCVDKESRVKEEQRLVRVPSRLPDSQNKTVDWETIEGRFQSGWVWNRTLTLKEDNKKNK